MADDTNNAQHHRFDIIVAGGGLIGKVSALALAKAGFKVALAAPSPPQADGRTTALMMPSIEALRELDVWSAAEPFAAPLKSMRIVDGTINLVRARPVTFNAGEINEDAFGWNIPNMALNAALDATIAKVQAIELFEEPVTNYKVCETEVLATLGNGISLTSALVVGADGRNSPARMAAGIKVKNWSYPQTAFVTTFEHRLPHQNMSTEFHTNSGPCVQVPLAGNKSSLVWVVTPERATALLELNADQLSWQIEQRLSSILGKVSVGTERYTYPLSGQYALRFASNRIALIGEAAHIFPPIGAQGLNLGLRDVADITQAAASNPLDPGSPQVLSLYEKIRRPDILARVGAVDALNRSLLSTLLPAQLARAFGLAMIDLTPPLRGVFMREGMRPSTGLSSLFSSIKSVMAEKRT
jgi:2-octaprenyl-6-methoxyphenol hydroxylase